MSEWTTKGTGSTKVVQVHKNKKNARTYSWYGLLDGSEPGNGEDARIRLQTYTKWQQKTTGKCPPPQLQYMFPPTKIELVTMSERKRIHLLETVDNKGLLPGNSSFLKTEMPAFKPIKTKDESIAAISELKKIVSFFTTEGWDGDHFFAFPDAKIENFMLTDENELKFVDLDGVLLVDDDTQSLHDIGYAIATYRGIYPLTDPWFMTPVVLTPGIKLQDLKRVLRYQTVFALLYTILDLKAPKELDALPTERTELNRWKFLKTNFDNYFQDDMEWANTQLTTLKTMARETATLYGKDGKVSDGLKMFAAFTDSAARAV